MTRHPFLDDDLRDRAAHYVLGTLCDEEARSVRLHLADCPACRSEVDALIELSRDLCLLYPAELPAPELWTRVVARIGEMSASSTQRPPTHHAARETHGIAGDASVGCDARPGEIEGDPFLGAHDRNKDRDGAGHARSSLTQVWKSWTSTSSRSPLADFTFVHSSAGDWQATAIDGIEARQLFVDPQQDRATFLVRMAPGAAYPAHVHAGPEECFVLEGDLEVGGLRMQAGDYQRAEPGSTHCVQSTEKGCLLLLVSSLRDELVE
jgi:anti-sigma factor ChrR (cupin superfamily)